jgi:hypothetical protein
MKNCGKISFNDSSSKVTVKEVLQKESYSRRTCKELFQRLVAPPVLKYGIRLGQAGRNGVRRGEEEGWSG